MSANARKACITVVDRCLQGEDLQHALNRILVSWRLSEADKGLVTKISYGYMRWKKRLDFILSRTVKGKLKKLPRSLVLRLGLAVYELCYLEKVPEYATVHWYVDNVKKEVAPGLSGLANAVLRGVIRKGREVHEPDFYWHGTSERDTFLGRYYSCPKWMVSLWRESYGDEACLSLLQKSLAPPPVGVRINRTLPEADQVYQSLAPEASHLLPSDWGLALPKSYPYLQELEEQGQISRQSYASQLVLSQLEPSLWPGPVWDACAGRGGKTAALAESLPGQLWASDLSPSRLKGLRRELTRLLLPSIPVFAHDASRSTCLRRKAGTILLDAPCSGLGVLSRRPDAKWKRTPQETARLAKIQRQILLSCLEVLCRGGWMLYVTCTLNPEENEQGIARFLEQAKGAVGLQRQFLTAEPGLNELFYAAVLQKK